MNATEIYEKLCRRFGTPHPGTVTDKFYTKLGRIVEEQGEFPYRIISACAADAVGKGSPDRYFAKAVLARLREHGIIAAPEL